MYNKYLDFRLEKVEYDQTDFNILREISINSRASFTEIGKIVGLTYWAVAQRYKRLTDKSIIIGLKPRINFKKLGYTYYHFFIETNKESIRKKIVSYYTQQKDCVMIMNHAGKYSLHLEIVIKKEEMSEFIMDFREKFGDDILSYEPILIFSEHVMNLLR